MIRFDERDAHTLICLQSNRSLPDDVQECVCRPRLPKTYRPTFEVEGPVAAPKSLFMRLVDFLVTLAVVGALSFTCGAILRHFGVI